jgi:hypothetical protein
VYEARASPFLRVGELSLIQARAYIKAPSYSLLRALLAPSYALRQLTITDLHLYITQPNYRPSILLMLLPTNYIIERPPY